MNENENENDKILFDFIMKAGESMSISDEEKEAMASVIKEMLEKYNLEIEDLEYHVEEAEMFESMAQEETNALFARNGIK